MGFMLNLERIIVRTNREEIREADNRFNQDLIGRAMNGLGTRETHTENAEHAYRKPIVIFDSARIAIRPFWRDGKQPPPLPSVRIDTQSRGHW